MAYLSNLIVAGNSKFLNKIYAEDLEVSGTFGTSGNVSVGGNLSVTGTSAFTGAITVSGESTFNNKVNFKGNGIELYHNTPYIDFHFKNSTADYTSRIIEESSGIITIKPNLVVGSSATIPTATITTGTISNATIGSGIVENLSVTDTLRATHYDLQTVAQLGGAFYVSPTVKFPTASNANIVVTKSGSTLTMVITDTSTITSTTMAGVVWQANAKIKASGKIGTVTTGTMDGTVTAINVNSHSMTINVSGGNADAIQARTYNKADIDNFCVMMYHTGSNPVGIMMNSYGTNGLTYIDIYGGSATSTYTTPNVRIGNLGGLTFNGSTLSNQWGIYTNNGYFSGKIIANGGTIGGFTIGSTAIYTGTLTSATDNYIGLSTADFTRSIGGTSRTGLRMAIGDKFGVTGDGIVYSSNLQTTGGNIGGWVINSTSLYKNSTEKHTKGYIQYGAILQAPTESAIESASGSVAFGVRQRTYTDGAYGSWTYPFIVHYDGSLKATNADISGKITATSGSINGSLVTSGINANNITAGTISIERLTSIKVGGRNLLKTNDAKYTPTIYRAYDLYLTEPIESGVQYILQLWDIDVSNDKKTDTTLGVNVYYCGGYVNFGAWTGTNFFTNGHADYLKLIFTAYDNKPAETSGGSTTQGDCNLNHSDVVNTVKKYIRLYNSVPSVDGAVYNMSVGKWKLEKGNKSTDWSPAPEDLDADITDASKVATNYIYYDATNGLIISDSADSQTYIGASRRYNTQLTNNALNIRNGTTVLASYGTDIILGNTIPTTEVSTPIYAKFSPKSMELYQGSTDSTQIKKLFNIGYGAGSGRVIESGKDSNTYVTTDDTGTITASSYTSNYDMVASNPPIIVQLRAVIKDTDASTDDESTDVTMIEPVSDDDTNYEGLLILNKDYTVDYIANTITLNTSAKNVTDFVSKYYAKYNIYIWTDYLAKNNDQINYYDLGIRNTGVSYGPYSLVSGKNNTASNTFSVSMGQNNKNAGYRAIVNGYSNEIAQGATCASIFGEGLKTIRAGSMVIGRYNSYDNGLFVVGNGTGTDNSNRQDAFVIRDRGKVYIYGDYAALTIAPNNNDGREPAHPDFNGGILNLSPSLQHKDLCGYSIKNVNDKLSIYATPSRDKTTRNYYGESLYIQSFNISGDKSTTEILRGVVLGRYDIQTTGYSISSLTSANTSYVATPTHTESSPNRIIRKNGIVVVEIEFTPKKATTAWQTIFTVPSGFRPFITHRNTVQGTTFQITSAGNVQAATALTTTAYHFYMVYPCKFPSNN